MDGDLPRYPSRVTVDVQKVTPDADVANAASTQGVESREADDYIYQDGLDYLSDELIYIRTLLQRYLDQQASLRPEQERLAGLAIGPDEIERFLDGATASENPDQAAYIQALRDQIDRRIAASRTAGISLPLIDLVERFGLSPIEARILLVLLAPELEPAFERAYAFAWNDFTRRTCDVGFVLAMAVPSFRQRCEVAHVFAPTEPLRWNGLVESPRTLDPTERGFLGRPVRLATRIAAFVLGDGSLDERIQPHASLLAGRTTWNDVVLQREDTDRLERTLRTAIEGGTARLALRGAPGCGKKLVLRAALDELGLQLISIDLESAVGAGDFESTLRAARREALLQPAALYVDCTAYETEDDIPRVTRLTLERVMRDFPGILAFGASYHVPFFGGVRTLTDVFVPIPEAGERTALWRRALGRVKLAPGTDPDAIGRQFPLSGGAITGAVRGAVQRARQRNAARPVVRRSDLLDAARQQLTGKLASLATRITTTLSWDDLVLPTESRERLNELIAFARNRKKVFDEWGFGALLPYGRGLSCLFHGPPGTGKTMVAGILAGELGMDLFRVDLSQVVSKYVGETEKNLGRIFDEASQSHSVLLFDEADSLFSKRTEVKSSNDRYANLEVNYLLQRMETFEGVTVLTTNFESGIDDAFKRRLRFRIEFPFPEQADRETLWRRMIPPSAEIETDIRWDDLAYDFELSGGHIKNAVLRAAFVAAERGDRIRYEDLRTAGNLECKEIGKLVREYPDDGEV